MRILISAYACEPDKGSEPGVGWKWANGLADRVELHVLTREGNRSVIEKAVSDALDSDPLRSIRFHFYDLSRPFLWAKKKHILPTTGYYMIWQWMVSRRFAHLADNCDVVHHLTFCTLLCPGFWKLKKSAFVLGPVGAPMVNPEYIPLFGEQAWQQRFRHALMMRFLKLPWLRSLLKRAIAIIPANSETRDLLLSRGIVARDVMLDTGSLEATAPDSPRQNTSETIRLIYAGQLERRKGLELSLRALAQVNRKGNCTGSFDIFGSGPDRQRLEHLTRELELNDVVCFHGAVPRVQLMKHFHQADAFLFTSVRDTSGGVNLEAMSHGLPIICIAHQGVGDITNDACAIRIAPGPIPETIDKLAAGILRLANDPALREQLGQGAKRRAAKDFSWGSKFERMIAIYRAAVHR